MGSTAKKLSTVTVTVTTTLTVDSMWLDHVTGGKEGFNDVFMQGYSGYWARGIDHTIARGWLVYERADDPNPTDAEITVAKRAWRAGETLPPRWHRFDQDLAERAWIEGVKKFGTSWFEDGDGPRYDWVLQKALWGPNEPCEVRYG